MMEAVVFVSNLKLLVLIQQMRSSVLLLFNITFRWLQHEVEPVFCSAYNTDVHRMLKCMNYFEENHL